MSKTFATNGLTPERRRYHIIKTSERRDVEGIKLGDKKMKFHPKSNSFCTNDTGLAREICNLQGQNGTNDVIVVPTEKWDHGHIRTMGGGENWADAWEAFEARRKDKNG